MSKFAGTFCNFVCNAQPLKLFVSWLKYRRFAIFLSVPFLSLQRLLASCVIHLCSLPIVNNVGKIMSVALLCLPLVIHERMSKFRTPFSPPVSVPFPSLLATYNDVKWTTLVRDINAGCKSRVGLTLISPVP